MKQQPADSDTMRPFTQTLMSRSTTYRLLTRRDGTKLPDIGRCRRPADGK